MTTHTLDLAWLKAGVRDIPDFPKPGILFRDITPLLKDPQRFRAVTTAWGERYRQQRIDAIAAIEARGFIFGSALAFELGVGLIPVRKRGKLPHDTHQVTYDLEYGTDTVEMHRDAVQPGDRVLIVDDVLATGGTSLATAQLVRQLNGEIAELVFLIELKMLHGRDRLKDFPIHALLQL